MFQTQPPLSWLKDIAGSIQWPLVVGASFWVGRIVKDLEVRLSKAESSLESLTHRHMPAIHRALAEIRGLLARD